MKKTDNSNLAIKLDLRRHFLNRYPPVSVLDCCQGSGALWKTLAQEFSPKTYLPVDVKPKKGRLKMDSSRLLAAGNWSFDCIDVDTYGEPWQHWKEILSHGKSDITVFLTIGMVRIMGGRVSSDVAQWCGMGPLLPIIPRSLQAKCAEIALPYALLQATLFEFSLVEVLEAPRAKNARYVGIRLEKTL